MSQQKKCFIISPIGEENSKQRKHADTVFKYIIKPALKECNIVPIRSDHMRDAGKITEQMFNAIQEFDMCIAVLAFDNPNVYYELAVAQCAARPVIILIEKGNEIPFDLKDERVIYYDLEIESYDEKIHINSVVDFIKNFEEINWNVPCSIPGFKSPRKDEEYQFFKKVFAFGDDDEWQKVINDSSEKLYLMGTALRTWRYLDDFDVQLIEKAKNGCEIRLMIMDPENEILRQIHDDKSPKLPDYETIRSTVLECSEFYSQCADKSEKIEFRLIRHGRLTLNQVINEKYCLYMPHFYSTLILYSPCWKFNEGSQIYKNLLKEFNVLWELNSPIKKVLPKEEMEEQEELLKELQSKLVNVEDLIDKQKQGEAIDELNKILETADLFNFEETRKILYEKLKSIRDPEEILNNVRKILEFEYENQRDITKAEMVSRLDIEISDTEYYSKIITTPVDYEQIETEKLKNLAVEILEKYMEPTLYDLVVTLNYDLKTAQKLGKFFNDNYFFQKFRLYPIKEHVEKKEGDLVIFLCNSSRDTEAFKIKEVSTKLESYREIKEVVFWRADVDFFDFIEKNLERCDVFVLFCSENALDSVAVKKDWTAADSMGKLIIPIFQKLDHVPALLKPRGGLEFDFSDFDRNIDRLHNLILKKAQKLIKNKY
ncbi:MAG: toll/interleukin-1 receptor domain-containing protein [Promethearchaeota archaeon]